MGVVVEICPFDQESHPKAGGLREAFAEIARRRCGGDIGTHGRVMREWGLTADQAKGLIEGKTSIRTMEMVLQHKNGGWRVGVSVLAIVTGKRLTDYFTSERNRLDHEAELRRQKAEQLGRAAAFLQSVDSDAHRPAVAGMGSR